jgi:hypothetical protein
VWTSRIDVSVFEDVYGSSSILFIIFSPVLISKMSGQAIKLPELENSWRWPRLVSPYLAEIEKECLEWSASFTAFDSETQSLVHEKGKLSQLPIFFFMPNRIVPQANFEIMKIFFPECAMQE